MSSLEARLRVLERTLSEIDRRSTPQTFAKWTIAEVSFAKAFARWKNGERVATWPDKYKRWLEKEVEFIMEFLNYPTGSLLVGSGKPMSHEELDAVLQQRFFAQVGVKVRDRKLARSLHDRTSVGT